MLIQLGHEPGVAVFKPGGTFTSSGYYRKGVLTGYIREANLLSSKEAVLCGLMYKILETSTSSVTQVQFFIFAPIYMLKL